MQPVAHHRPARVLLCLLVICLFWATTGCKEGAGAGISAPKTLPTFMPVFVEWAVSKRARDKAAEGAQALTKGQLERGRSLLTEAISLDPSWIAARIDLARLYLGAGHEKTVLDLLRPLTEADEECGGCIDAFDRLVGQAEFAPFFAAGAGKVLLQSVPKHKLDWLGWANGFGAALAGVDGEALGRFVHPEEPFALVRSCPECSNPERRKDDVRQLRGAAVAVKLAARFDTTRPRLDTVPLRLQENPTCTAGCCTWPTPASVTVGEAVLAGVCFRPMNVHRAAITRVEVVYGQSVNDRQQVEAAERRRREVEGIALGGNATPTAR